MTIGIALQVGFILILWIVGVRAIIIQGYLAWTNPSALQSLIITRHLEKLPRWWPFRQLQISWAQTGSWIWFMRILTIIALPMALLAGLIGIIDTVRGVVF